MFETNAAIEPLRIEAYRNSQVNIRRLKQKLPPDRVANLAREVIYRLAARGDDVADVDHGPSPGELEKLCTALICEDDMAAADMIASLRADGMSVDVVYLKYLAAAARMLGEWWLEDRADFVEVTMGTGRMFSIMRGMRHHFATPARSAEKSAIFAPVPGDNHTLGVRMATDLFRKEGWQISLKIGLDHDALISEIEKAPGSIVGLSIGGRHSLDALSRLVVALHICQPAVPIMVCGQNIEDIRPILSLMGLDGIAGTFEDAKELMTALQARRAAKQACASSKNDQTKPLR